MSTIIYLAIGDADLRVEVKESAKRIYSAVKIANANNHGVVEVTEVSTNTPALFNPRHFVAAGSLEAE